MAASASPTPSPRVLSSNPQFATLARRLLPLAGLLLLSLYFSLRSPEFLTVDNGFNIARQQSIIILIAFGATLVIIAGQIDLSVGSVAAFSGVAAAWLLNSQYWPANLAAGFGILVGMLCGATWGALNAFLVGWLRLPSFVATLGTMGMARGLTYIVAGGQTVDMKANLRPLAEGNWLGLPVPIWIVLSCAILLWWVLRCTVIGRAIYAVGGNAQAARFAGIDERKTLLFVYTVAGALTGLAAMIEVARLSNSAQPNTGDTYPLDAIAAVVIGGGSLLGGEGSIAGTVIGALVIAVLRNGLNLLQRDAFEQMVLIGALIIAAVALDQWRRARN